MILLHDMDDAQKSIVRKRLAAYNGQALVVVHPLYFGCTAEERAWVIAKIVTQTTSTTKDGLAEGILEDQKSYLDGLQTMIDHPLFNNSVGFVFEDVDQLSHVDHLQSINADLVWVVIPTYHRSACPKHGSWQDTMKTMVSLGLKDAYVGGCYCVVSDSKPAPTQIFYSCVNDLYYTLLNSRLFERVQIIGSATYTQELALIQA